MNADLTWQDVLQKYADIVQDSDKGQQLAETRCRHLFAEALPASWLREHGLAAIPMQMRMRSRHIEGFDAIISATCIRVHFVESHPLYVPQFARSPQKVPVAEDTLCIKKADGVWVPSGNRLHCSFYQDMLEAERILIETYTACIFEPAAYVMELSEEIGMEKIAKLYQAVQTIHEFTPATVKQLPFCEIADLAAKGRKAQVEKDSRDS